MERSSFQAPSSVGPKVCIGLKECSQNGASKAWTHSRTARLPVRHLRLGTAPAAAAWRGGPSSVHHTWRDEVDKPIRKTQKVAKMLKMLRLESLSNDEIQRAFDTVDKDRDGILSREDVKALLTKGRRLNDTDARAIDVRIDRFMFHFDTDKDSKVSQTEFKTKVEELAAFVDPRVYIVAACMAAVGLGNGIIVPLMPQLIKELGLGVADFGLATSAKGAAQMLANVPAAGLVVKFGTVPILTASLGLVGASIASLSAVSGSGSLVVARMLSGAAAAGFMAAATAYVISISNPHNRARSLAPVMATFGTSLMFGPAIGGFLSGGIGLHSGFLVAGCISGTMAVLATLAMRSNHTETQGRRSGKTGQTPAACGTNFSTWQEILRVPGVSDVVIQTGMYNFVVASAQLTLLPVFLTSTLGMSAASMGSVFAGMAAMNVLFARRVAVLSDSVGHEAIIGPGGMLRGFALMVLPFISDFQLAMPLLAVWAAGNCLTGSSPTNFASSAVPPALRVQAIALLRTSGDLGFLMGGVGGGLAAGITSVPTALGAIGLVSFLSASVFAMRARAWGSQQETSGALDLKTA